MAFLSPPPALVPALRYGSETVGAESEDDEVEDEDEEEEAEGVSFPWPAGGAESFEGKDFLSSLAGFRLVPSPKSGVDFDEFMASLVFGFERVPRTDLECELSTIVAVFFWDGYVW
jgi:hypothetical protein